MIEQLRNYDIENNAIILAYTPDVIKQFIGKTSAELFYVFDNNSEFNISFCIENNLNACIKHNFVDKQLVERFHSNSLKINAWTVNDIFTYMHLSSIGVDYITSDILR